MMPSRYHSVHSLRIPPLVSGGVMLFYHCSNACRHCLYHCSPKRPDRWVSQEMAEGIFTALARETHLESIHLAGDEATLRFDLLLEMVRLANRIGVPLAYLETNASWCADRGETRQKLAALSGWRHAQGAGRQWHVVGRRRLGR